jgi:hypothetical protein
MAPQVSNATPLQNSASMRKPQVAGLGRGVARDVTPSGAPQDPGRIARSSRWLSAAWDWGFANSPIRTQIASEKGRMSAFLRSTSYAPLCHLNITKRIRN